ncbi:hypothetical protein F5X97DRAFT_315863 [Nemania serpens]|nr:hypothetical protein F5X97DRAFT_315863 [Nemania serpens]
MTAVPNMSNSTIGWQASPTERGTLTLVYSCVITIFTCTWTVLHLNVPGLDDELWEIAIRKAKWMAINILIPEFIFAKAVCDLRLALNDLREFDDNLKREYEDNPGLAWTEKHENFEHTYSWQVDYGPRAGLLYRFLGLQLPVSRDRLVEITAKRGDNSPNATSSPKLESVSRFRTTRSWTLAHAYLANMGGLMYLRGSDVQENKLHYHVLSGVKLSDRYEWRRVGYSRHRSDDHPLHGLVLKKEDIEDKSKADWLLKCFTVLQVIWLVLTVVVRGVEGLPVTQLEIATVAFSISAIFTHAANWWKPKDVSRPILIKKPCDGEVSRANIFNPAQKFTLRLTNLTDAKVSTARIDLEARVRNDITWMEEGVPLIFSIMAVSSLVFGGLHLIAWNFEFPSRAELMLWRVSGLTSAILPLISLGLNQYLNYLAITHTNTKMLSYFLEMRDNLNKYPEAFWSRLTHPPFQDWDEEKRAVLCSTRTGLRNFNEEPRIDNIQNRETIIAENIGFASEVKHLGILVQDIHHLWEIAGKDIKDIQDLRLLDRVSFAFEYVVVTRDALEFWDDFENYLWKDSAAPDSSIPGVKCVRSIINARERYQRADKRCEARKRAYNQISRFLFIGSSMIYIAARLIILVLLFTSLRAVPKGVYEDAPWTRFLPSFS